MMLDPLVIGLAGQSSVSQSTIAQGAGPSMADTRGVAPQNGQGFGLTAAAYNKVC
jgi:hypothetical protein